MSKQTGGRALFLEGTGCFHLQQTRCGLPSHIPQRRVHTFDLQRKQHPKLLAQQDQSEDTFRSVTCFQNNTHCIAMQHRFKLPGSLRAPNPQQLRPPEQQTSSGDDTPSNTHPLMTQWRNMAWLQQLCMADILANLRTRFDSSAGVS